MRPNPNNTVMRTVKDAARGPVAAAALYITIALSFALLLFALASCQVEAEGELMNLNFQMKDVGEFKVIDGNLNGQAFRCVIDRRTPGVSNVNCY